MKILRIVFILCCFLTTTLFFAQSNDYTNKIRKTYDSIAGYKNLSLLNGVEFLETNRTLNNRHQYFIARDFLEGEVIYDGQKFTGLKLRYDIFRDILTIKLEKNIEGTLLLELIKSHIQDFYIQNHHFKNLEITENEFESGFYEVISNDKKISIYKKRRLRRLDKRDRQVLYYEFENLDDNFIFYSPDLGYFETDSSDLKRLFPQCKKLFSKYINDNRELNKQNSDEFMIGLGSLLSQSNCNNKEAE